MLLSEAMSAAHDGVSRHLDIDVWWRLPSL
jgi:hypothetical protein